MIGPLHNARAMAPDSVDTTELGGILADLAGIHAGIDLIRDGLRLLAHDRLTVDKTQTISTALAGNADCDVVSAVAELVARLTNPDTNPAIRSLPVETQKAAQHQGERALFALTDPDLRAPAADAAAELANH